MDALQQKQDAFIAKTLKVYVDDDEKCAIYGGECVYRHELEDGTILKCALGQHIRDDRYSPDMEGVNADTLINDWEEVFLTDEAREVDVPARGWYYVQAIHDCMATTADQLYIDRVLSRLTDVMGFELPQTKEVLSKYKQQ